MRVKPSLCIQACSLTAKHLIFGKDRSKFIGSDGARAWHFPCAPLVSRFAITNCILVSDIFTRSSLRWSQETTGFRYLRLYRCAWRMLILLLWGSQSVITRFFTLHAVHITTWLLFWDLLKLVSIVLCRIACPFRFKKASSFWICTSTHRGIILVSFLDVFNLAVAL